MSHDNIAVQMRQAESLLKAKANRTFFATSHTLQQITMRSILTKNMMYFCELANLKPNMNPFSKIPPGLKKELIELIPVLETENMKRRIADDPEQQCQMLQLLLNHKMTSFHFPRRLKSDHEEAASELWCSLIKQRPPNLTTIVSNPYLFDGEFSWDIDAFITYMLPVFHQLEELKIGHLVCDDADLRRIAKNMPSLRVLEVEMSHNVSWRGILALRKLTLLEELIFNIFDFPWQRDLLCKTYKLLPHLHVAGMKPAEPFSRDTVAWSEVSSMALDEISSTSSCTLQLHHLARLTLDYGEIRITEFISLPEVLVLYLLYWSYDEEMPLFPGHFPKLTELNMVDSVGANLMQIIGHGVGQQLLTLRVCFPIEVYRSLGAPLQLDEVLGACPNLSELCMDVKGVDSATELQPDSLHQLRVLRIYSEKWENLQTGLVMQLLRLAPNLCTVELTSAMLEVEDLEHLAELVEQRACLQQLEQLQVTLVTKATNFTELKLALDVFIISCSKHCKQLRQVVVAEDLHQWSFKYNY